MNNEKQIVLVVNTAGLRERSVAGSRLRALLANLACEMAAMEVIDGQALIDTVPEQGLVGDDVFEELLKPLPMFCCTCGTLAPEWMNEDKRYGTPGWCEVVHGTGKDGKCLPESWQPTKAKQEQWDKARAGALTKEAQAKAETFTETSTTTRKCPHCLEQIAAYMGVVKHCPHCGKDTTAPPVVVNPNSPLVGYKVVEQRAMTTLEAKAEGWNADPRDRTAVVLVFESGVKVYASRDEEGNGPGVLFATHNGKQFGLLAPALVPTTPKKAKSTKPRTKK